jgi:FKBP-type peptidyl-prolyl cis-trans isomerase FkpA
VKKLFVCVAVALLAAGCNSEDGGGGSPTDPSQVNISFSTTDLVVGTGAEAVAGLRATTNFELWLYNAAGTASKGTRIQGSSDANPQVPGTTIGPITIVVGTGQLIPGPGQVIPGFEQGVRGMRVGGKRRIYIPPNLAYGSSGTQGGQIPPNASIVFEVELTNIQ